MALLKQLETVATGERVALAEVEHFLQRLGQNYNTISRENAIGGIEMLCQAIPICVALGINRALVTCDVNNVGSMKAIERCGGILEGVVPDPDRGVQKRRYWLQTA